MASFLLRLSPAEHAALVARGFARPCDPARPAAYLRVNGWREDRRAWWSPCGVDWSVRAAVALQQMRDAVTYLEARGRVVTCGGRRCTCTDPRCTRACGQAVWPDVAELRDPGARRYVRSWRTAVRTQQRREAEAGPETAPAAARPVRTAHGHAWLYRVGGARPAVRRGAL
jgi:hypothetical protein